MKPNKIYISGRITGMEKEAAELFAKAEQVLLAKNFTPVNPMLLPHNHDKKWVSYMKECLKVMLQCDGLYMLDNWQQSEGALTEWRLAKKLNMPIMYQNPYFPAPEQWVPEAGC